jgi:hypothetical protein
VLSVLLLGAGTVGAGSAKGGDSEEYIIFASHNDMFLEVSPFL